MRNRTAFTFLLIYVLINVFSFSITRGDPTDRPSFLNSTTIEKQPSIIILIGDGMGPNHIELGRLVEYGENADSSINEFPYYTLVETHEYNGEITDSAAAATAIATGVITANGRIGQDKDEKELKTILEIAEENGYRTGLVSTTQMNHATPASFAAHEASRNNYVNIAADMASQNIEILFGGGTSNEYFGTQISNLQTQGYTYVTDKSELKALSTIPALGLFSYGGLPNGRILMNESSIPNLLDMTVKAIDLLSSEDNPFFLMVEGGQIDWRSHSNLPTFAAHEIIEFEKTVQYVKSLAESDPLLQVIVTADHETGGLSINSYDFHTPIPEEDDDIAIKIEKRTNRSKEISTSFSSIEHTSLKVVMTGIGPHTDQITQAEHTSDAFSIMKNAITPSDITSKSSETIGFSVIIGISSFLLIVPYIEKQKKSRNNSI
ncbi:MAG: alkaline phosphatase [Candidatus Kariarchaeaceae archaeon]|jgi:alkaline phosphatase